MNASTGGKIWNFTTGYEIGWSTPAVANGVIYIGSYDKVVYALNASTGSKLRGYATGDYLVSCPTVADGIVYIGSDDDTVYALNASVGSKVWS